MSQEEKLEMGRKLIAEAEAEIAAKKRNWPKKVGAGDCFERNGSRYVMLAGQLIDLDRDVTWAGVAGFDGNEKDFAYLGKLDLTIRAGAHEPTGAELVGKMCMFRGYNLGQDNPEEWFGPWMCQTFDPDDQKSAYRTGEVGKLTGWYKEARLAKDA